MQQDNMSPVNRCQNHHLYEKIAVKFDDIFTAPSKDADMKNSRMGSSKMYCVKVIRPISKKS